MATSEKEKLLDESREDTKPSSDDSSDEMVEYIQKMTEETYQPDLESDSQGTDSVNILPANLRRGLSNPPSPRYDQDKAYKKSLPRSLSEPDCKKPSLTLSIFTPKVQKDVSLSNIYSQRSDSAGVSPLSPSVHEDKLGKKDYQRSLSEPEFKKTLPLSIYSPPKDKPVTPILVQGKEVVSPIFTFVTRQHKASDVQPAKTLFEPDPTKAPDVQPDEPQQDKGRGTTKAPDLQPEGSQKVKGRGTGMLLNLKRDNTFSNITSIATDSVATISDPSPRIRQDKGCGTGPSIMQTLKRDNTFSNISSIDSDYVAPVPDPSHRTKSIELDNVSPNADNTSRADISSLPTDDAIYSPPPDVQYPRPLTVYDREQGRHHGMDDTISTEVFTNLTQFLEMQELQELDRPVAETEALVPRQELEIEEDAPPRRWVWNEFVDQNRKAFVIAVGGTILIFLLALLIYGCIHLYKLITQ